GRTLPLALGALVGERGAQATDSSNAKNNGDDVPRRAPTQAMHLAPFFSPRLAETRTYTRFCHRSRGRTGLCPTFPGSYISDEPATERENSCRVRAAAA